MKKILLVDDAVENLDILSEILMEHYEVMAAVNGVTAIKILETRGTPDLVITDLIMPGIDGLELCKIIREHKLWKEVPVLFFSGYLSPEDREEMVKAGGSGFLFKPVTGTVLLEKVKEFLHE